MGSDEGGKTDCLHIGKQGGDSRPKNFEKA